MGLTQEALEGVPHGIFLEDAWLHFCLHTLTRGSKLGFYRMEYGTQEGLWGGKLDLPPYAFLFPLPRTAGGPKHSGGLAPQEPGHFRL